MSFVNSYGFDGPAGFHRCLAVGSGSILAVGSDHGQGIVAHIAPSGILLWSRRYHVDGDDMAFIDATAAPRGGWTLLALSGPRGERQQHVVVRIDVSGSVQWARRVLEGRADPGARIFGRPGRAADVLVMGGPLRTASTHGIAGGRLVRLSDTGALMRTVDLDLRDQAGGRLFDGVAMPEGYLLVGEAGEARTLAQWTTPDREVDLDAVGANGLVIDLDPELNLRSAWLLSESTIGRSLSARAVLRRSDGTLAVAGCAEDRGRRRTFLAEFHRNGELLVFDRARFYALSAGRDRPARLVEAHAGSFVLDRPSSAAPDARVLHANQTLQPAGLHRFTFDAAAEVFDLCARDARAIAVAGAAGPAEGGRAFALSVDVGFACCRTVQLAEPDTDSVVFAVARIVPVLSEIRAAILPITLRPTRAVPAVYPLCGTGLDGWGKETLVQSPYLNLQAAGSLGVGASRGMLLRWFLGGALGASHLPKGDLASAWFPGSFNRADDYVILRRAPWPAVPPLRRLNFATDPPIHFDQAKRLLAFGGSSAGGGFYLVRFLDAAAFAAAGSAGLALNDPSAFISAYGAHPIEIELRGALALACDLIFAPNTGATVKVETLSVAENLPLAAKHVSARRTLTAADGPIRRLLAENLKAVRVQCAGTQIDEVAFIVYDDLLSELSQARAWIELGRFALTDQQAEAFERLEEPSRFQVHGLWRRFNDGSFVNVANYRHRWTASGGLGAGVATYIQLSNSDPQAVAQLPGATIEDGSISASYLDLLQLAAIDYHAARMLGLGYVDTAPTDQAKAYVYLIEYRTEGDLDDGAGARQVQHLYLSLPTRLQDERLPLTPELLPVEYGLSVPIGSGGAHWLTDAQGYTPDGHARYIRLYPSCKPLYEQAQGFFNPPDSFDLSEASLPVCYGIEYRSQGQTAWERPEIAHDDAYLDTASPGVPEAVPTPFPATQKASAFVHRETRSGVHEYAAYAIDLFFRPSTLGPVRATDLTQFRRPNRLLPPSDLAVQLIQKESPLVLTAAAEQTMLAGLVQGGGDATLTRLTFEYGFVQEAAYDFADKVEIFFRPRPVRNVLGGVKAIGPASDPALIRIETKPYTYDSTGQTISPVILPADRPSFLGGALVVGGRRFTIEDISWANASTGVDPVFLVRRPQTTGVVHTVGAAGDPGIDTLVVQDAPLDIHVGDLIMAVENMASAANWSGANPLAASVSIGDSTWQTRVESFVSGGVTTSRRLRGVWETATVAAVSLPDGLYDIVFDSYVLGPHPQSKASAPVDWWKGTVRVPVQGRDPEDRRPLKVLRVLTSGSGKLQLLAKDESGEADPVLGGAGRLVNYYPGYRVYLHADTAHGFDSTTVMPAPGQGSRLSLVGARSCDTVSLDPSGQAYDYRSSLSPPAVLTAVEIIEPGQPDKPTGLLYAAPPDRYGVASYSLTVGFQGRTPFAVTFFRADALSILRALYAPATCEAVIGWLFPPAAWFTERFDDLFTFLESPTQATPTAYPPNDSAATALPFPDAPALNLTSSTSLADAKALMREAVTAAFVGLTEQPLPYGLIKSDPYLPTNRKQVFRDANGDLLSPSDPAFDLSPMARRLADGSVQFVDFTLGGAMNPNTVVFYFAREIGNRLQLGDPSPIWGPIALVNLAASSTPKVRKITSVPADAATGAGPMVRFEVIAPPVTDPVSKLRIHRALDAASALSIRTMAMVKEFVLSSLAVPPEGALLAEDDFDSGDLPWGQPLYYRLVWVREVAYAAVDLSLGIQTAEVISEPTRTFLANIVDIDTPAPPVPVLSVLSVEIDGSKRLRMTWAKTVHNGTYYVSQLDGSGNWFRLGQVTTNDGAPVFDLPEPLPPVTEDGDPIFYRFKIDAESSGGRTNRLDAPAIVDLTTL